MPEPERDILNNSVESEAENNNSLAAGFNAPPFQLQLNPTLPGTVQVQNKQEDEISVNLEDSKQKLVYDNTDPNNPPNNPDKPLSQAQPPPFQLKSSSQSGMPSDTLSHMSSSFGKDFSDVNIHQGSQSAVDAGALAYTQGNNIHFAPGQYDPSSQSGQELLGHELTHVVQQREGRVQANNEVNGMPLNDDKGLEQEADQIGAQVAQRQKISNNSENLVQSNSLSNIVQRHPGHSTAPGSPAPPTTATTPTTTATTPTTTGGTPGATTATPRARLEGPMTAAEEAAKTAFLARAVYGPTDAVSSTGFGRMSSAFSTVSRALTSTVQAKVVFHSGLVLNSSGRVSMVSTGQSNEDAILQTSVNTANNLPRARRRAFVNRFTWTPQEITSGMAGLSANLRRVESIWSGRHSFYINKVGWDDITSSVAVRINESIGTATVAGGDQLKIMNVKTPPDVDLNATVYSPGSTSNFNNMVIDDSKSSGVNPSNFLRETISFGYNSAVLTAGEKAKLDVFAARFQDDNTRNTSVNNNVLNAITVQGHASRGTNRARNQEVGQQRITAVKSYLQSKGMHRLNERVVEDNQGDTGSTGSARDRKVELIVGSGEQQNTLAHEFGHVFGLDDEYALDPGNGITGTGNATGTAVGHNRLATGIGAGNATSENNDGIMSAGNEVRGQHYATFGESLKNITGIQEWTLG